MVRNVVAGVAAALLVGACATRADSPPDLSAAITIASLHAAPDALAAVGSGRFEMRVELPDAPEWGAISSSGSFAGGRISMDIDVDMALAGAMVEADRPIPEGILGPVQMVIDADTVFLRIGIWEELLSIRWLSLTPDDLVETRGTLGFDVAALNPVRLVDTLLDVVGDIEERGQEQVRGVTTTHVRASTEHGVDVELWMGAEGLARRLRVVVDDVPELGRVSTTLELFAYAEPIEIVLPPPGEVTPISEVLPTFFADDR